MTKILKNVSKLLACTLVVLLTFVLTLSTATAKAPNTITIKAADYTKDFLNNNDNAMFMYKTTDGVTVYCMDIDKKPVLQGQTANLTGDADAGVLYILKNGYPNKSYRKNNGMDAYITQMALWWYLSESKLSDNFKNASAEVDSYSLVPAARQLKDLAKSATAPAEPSMTVSDVAKTLTLTSDGKYYESAYMSATTKVATTYNVELSGATKSTVVVDEGNRIGTTMNSGEKFKVRVPAAEVTKDLKIGVKFTTTASVDKAKIYTPSDNSYQRVVGIFPETKTLTKDVELTLTKKRSCEYDKDTKKYYGKDGSEVNKEEYQKQCDPRSCEYDKDTKKYYGKDGSVVTKDEYTKQCLHICEYTDKKYYGKNGTVVTKEQFNKECNKSCEYDKDAKKYYGKDGSEVTKEEYKKQCEHVCEFYGGSYYGKDGKKVSEAQFDKDCNKHVCEYIDGTYYGSEGTAVDQNTYNNQCGEEVVVPSTGSNASALAIILGTIMTLAGASLIAYRRKTLV